MSLEVTVRYATLNESHDTFGKMENKVIVRYINEAKAIEKSTK